MGRKPEPRIAVRGWSRRTERKRWDQEECGLAKHGTDAVPGCRFTGARPHTALPHRVTFDALKCAFLDARDHRQNGNTLFDDWVLEFDIKGLFDNFDHALLLRAVHKHVQGPWALLYIERWLTAPMEQENGTIIERTRGTPQGVQRLPGPSARVESRPRAG